MVIIIVDQYLTNSNFYKHIFLDSTNKLCKSAEKCDDEKQFKAIIEASMASTLDEINNNMPMEIST